LSDGSVVILLCRPLHHNAADVSNAIYLVDAEECQTILAIIPAHDGASDCGTQVAKLIFMNKRGHTALVHCMSVAVSGELVDADDGLDEVARPGPSHEGDEEEEDKENERPAQRYAIFGSTKL
jgi:hypothetical protein